MNGMLVWIEAGSFCLLFTVVALLLRQNVSFAALNYPPAIVDRLIQLGKIKEEKPLPLQKRLLKKLPILVFYVVGFSCLLRYVNGCRNFLEGFLSCLIILSVFDWYDALFLDCVLFCNTKLFVLEGTEDMRKEYHDYSFHIKGSCRGMVLVLVGSLAVGGVVALLGLI